MSTKWWHLKTFSSVPAVDPNDAHNQDFVTGRTMTFDGVTRRAADVNVVESVSKAHNLVHDGSLFEVSHIFTSIANSTFGAILIETGANELHGAFVAAVEGASFVYVHENPVVSTTGTTLAPVTFNRMTSPTYLTTFSFDNVFSTVGSILSETFVPAGLKSKVSGGASAGLLGDTEWIFAPNTSYLLRVFNDSGSNEILSIDGIFYEQ